MRKIDENSWIKLVAFILIIYTNIFLFGNFSDHKEMKKHELIKPSYKNKQQISDKIYHKNKGKYSKNGVVFGEPIELKEETETVEIEDEVTV